MEPVITTDTAAIALATAAAADDTGIVTNADGSKTVTLEFPIQSMGEKVTTITLRRPKVKEARAMDSASGSVGKTAALIGKLAEMEPSAVDTIDLVDFTSLSEVIEGFTKRSRATGAPSSPKPATS